MARPSKAKSHLHIVPGPSGMSGEPLRLLQALGTPNSYAVLANPPDQLQVVTQRKGVSVVVARALPACADTLVAADLAHWMQDVHSHKRRLVLTPAGEAQLGRQTASRASPSQKAAPRTLDATVPVSRFRLQHGDVETRKGSRGQNSQAPAVERAESPLAWLATRKGRDGQPLLSPEQFEAGERLRRDLTQAQMLPRLTANWSGAPRSDPSGVALSYSDAVLAARQRVRLALEAAGSDFAGLLMDVCGFLKGLETVESERGWPPRSARIVLTLALGALARHYGPRRSPTAPSNSPRIRHWGTGDFRPTL